MPASLAKHVQRIVARSAVGREANLNSALPEPGYIQDSVPEPHAAGGIAGNSSTALGNKRNLLVLQEQGVGQRLIEVGVRFCFERASFRVNPLGSPNDGG